MCYIVNPENGVRKGLFVHDPPNRHLYVEEVIKIAKAEARKGIGFASRLFTCDVRFVSELSGWSVVVESC